MALTREQVKVAVESVSKKITWNLEDDGSVSLWPATPEEKNSVAALLPKESNINKIQAEKDSERKNLKDKIKAFEPKDAKNMKELADFVQDIKELVLR